jgi:hypothetical protein
MNRRELLATAALVSAAGAAEAIFNKILPEFDEYEVWALYMGSGPYEEEEQKEIVDECFTRVDSLIDRGLMEHVWWAEGGMHLVVTSPKGRAALDRLGYACKSEGLDNYKAAIAQTRRLL